MAKSAFLLQQPLHNRQVLTQHRRLQKLGLPHVRQHVISTTSRLCAYTSYLLTPQWFPTPPNTPIRVYTHYAHKTLTHSCNLNSSLRSLSSNHFDLFLLQGNIVKNVAVVVNKYTCIRIMQVCGSNCELLAILTPFFVFLSLLQRKIQVQSFDINCGCSVLSLCCFTIHNHFSALPDVNSI